MAEPRVWNMRNRKKKFLNVLSIFLLAGGLYFIVSGAREYFGSKFGQTAIEHQWEETAKKPLPPERPPELGDAVAELTIPRLDTQLFVVEGTTHSDLREGPGHMQGTAMPGAPGNCVIAGHRDTHFRVLKDIQKGDQIVLQTRYGKFYYRVTQLSIVSPRNTSSLQPSTDKELHLITCYPFYYVGPAPKRFVVQAEETKEALYQTEVQRPNS